MESTPEENEAEVLIDIGVAFEACGRHGDALNVYKRAVELAPGNGTARFNVEKPGGSVYRMKFIGTRPSGTSGSNSP